MGIHALSYRYLYAVMAFFVLIGGLLLLPSTLRAEESSFLESFYDISFIPELPRPNETVIAEIKTFSTDLNYASISWYVNGKLQKSGVGEKKITFKTGPLGSMLDVSVIVVPIDAPPITKKIVMKPAGVEIAWRANTYTPPFYKGKALFTNQSSATIFALPHFIGDNGRTISAKNLIYKWKIGNKVMQESSGYGKDSFIIPDTIRFSPLRISVEVSSSDNSIRAAQMVEIESFSPKLVLYPESPLYGVMTNHLLTESYAAESNEVTVFAMPYFYSLPLTDSVVEYDWRVNGKSVTEKKDQKNILVRRDSNMKKGSLVQVQVRNSQKPFDRLSVGSTITFTPAR